MSDFIFYAVCDEDGKVVCINNSKYPSLKAVFYLREDAEKALDKNADKNLHISEINIIEV
ncbi:TPA: hypothetical protein SMN48_003166 [Proteus mirabilis]|uniref:hypothetical protein n=1 Tax=Enterobacterales TaxID=91347 RepID=UPI001A304DC7|nr:hypothetical protein [Proteus mirabilis]MBI6323225.1 hypothetical protein [Proteus mirabilis]HCD1179009.1 hypothetical protein [Proteus mirabilis]HEJ9702756.1 hypothetical protein [Proteus mirabilis]HEK1986931.1 hypothetical protein [Proteus mirabilis]